MTAADVRNASSGDQSRLDAVQRGDPVVVDIGLVTGPKEPRGAAEKKGLSWHQSAQRGWSMTVDQLREWLSIPPGTLQRVCDINNRVIGQARRELDQKASISFRPRPIREGRGTGGWFFEVVDNKPKPKRRRPLPPAEPTPGLSDEELARGRAMLAELKAKVQKAA